MEDSFKVELTVSYKTIYSYQMIDQGLWATQAFHPGSLGRQCWNSQGTSGALLTAPSFRKLPFQTARASSHHVCVRAHDTKATQGLERQPQRRRSGSPWTLLRGIEGKGPITMREAKAELPGPLPVNTLGDPSWAI